MHIHSGMDPMVYHPKRATLSLHVGRMQRSYNVGHQDMHLLTCIQSLTNELRVKDRELSRAQHESALWEQLSLLDVRIRSSVQQMCQIDVQFCQILSESFRNI